MKQYVFVHDKKIVEEFERHQKFTGDYTYVFLGYKELPKVENLIVCRDYKNNIEKYKTAVVYTGWHCLHSNKLITDSENLFLEYDVIFNQQWLQNVESNKSECVSFIKNDINYMFESYIKPLIKLNNKSAKQKIKPFSEFSLKATHWMGSNNIKMTSKFFASYMNWFAPKFELIKNHPNVGHIIERSITLYAILNNIQYDFCTEGFKHFFLDSHDTQGKPFGDWESYIGTLATSK